MKDRIRITLIDDSKKATNKIKGKIEKVNKIKLKLKLSKPKKVKSIPTLPKLANNKNKLKNPIFLIILSFDVKGINKKKGS